MADGLRSSSDRLVDQPSWEELLNGEHEPLPERPIDPENYRFRDQYPCSWQYMTAADRKSRGAYLQRKEEERKLDKMIEEENAKAWKQWQERRAMDECPSPHYRSMPGYCHDYEEQRPFFLEERAEKMRKEHRPSPESTPPASPGTSQPIPNKRQPLKEPELSFEERMELLDARLVAKTAADRREWKTSQGPSRPAEEPNLHKRKREVKDMHDAGVEPSAGSAPKKRRVADPATRKTCPQILRAKAPPRRRPCTRSCPGATISLHSKKGEVLVESRTGVCEVMNIKEFKRHLPDE